VQARIFYTQIRNWGEDHECKAPPKLVEADPDSVLTAVGSGTESDGIETIMTKPNLA